MSSNIEKKKELFDLLPFIPNVFHDFYKNIKTFADIKITQLIIENE